MALGQRRMVHTDLWSNPQFFRLPDQAKIMYIALITFADDDGRLRANSMLLRSQVFPMDENIAITDIKKWLNDIVRAGLVEFYRVNDQYFIQHPNWKKYQSIRKDLYKSSNLPQNPLRKSTVPVTKSHPNSIQYNISKDKGLRTFPEYLEKIPEEDMTYFTTRFDATRKQIISKAEDLSLWLKSNNKAKKDHRSFLLNALKRDFQEKLPLKTEPKPEQYVQVEITPEVREKLKEISAHVKTLGNSKRVDT